mmetsp:Transcript_22286/g.68792  ORF Transcript_22286/g.68792 Transcript_22286/m.68792 type:complete len:89 (+) Transcript_22286:1428-1694(+)
MQLQHNFRRRTLGTSRWEALELHYEKKFGASPTLSERLQTFGMHWEEKASAEVVAHRKQTIDRGAKREELGLAPEGEIVGTESMRRAR